MIHIERSTDYGLIRGIMTQWNVYRHLADDFSRYVEIGPQGWKVASSGRVIFETSRSTLPLPQPKLPEPGAPPRSTPSALSSISPPAPTGSAASPG